MGRPPSHSARAAATGEPVPGANLALASLICSLAGLIICGCLAPVGAVLGYQALQQLPPDAARSVQGQAKAGMWIGGIATGFMVLAVLLAAVFFIFIASIDPPR